MAQLPAYVINLDRRPDRWRAISENLERIGVDARRIAAVDAQQLAERQTREIARGNGPLFSINLGAAACIQGHRKAMVALLESDRPAALILEDDAELAPDTPGLLESTDWWPAGTMVVRLEDGLDKLRLLRRPCGATPTGRRLHRFERWMPGSAGYLVNREGARLALDAFADPTETTDHTLFDLRVSETARRFRTVQIVPAMVRQRERSSTSDIATWRDAAEPKGLERQNFRLKRSLRSFPYKAKLLRLRLTGEVRRGRVRYGDRPDREDGGVENLG